MSPEIRALILYAYGFGGNTRDMARLTGIPHDDVTDALMLAAHEAASEELDDDGDDEPVDGESFDGGFGPGSYFSRAMQKDD